MDLAAGTMMYDYYSIEDEELIEESVDELDTEGQEFIETIMLHGFNR